MRFRCIYWFTIHLLGTMKIFKEDFPGASKYACIY